MNPPPVSNDEPAGPARRMSFSISNLLLIVTLTAICIAWYVDHHRPEPETENYDIPGPVLVSYRIRTSESSTSGSTVEAIGINYHGNHIIVHTRSGGFLLPVSRLISFRWTNQ